MPDPQVFTVPGLAYALSFFLGITESVMWILWGERYACVKANFTLRHIGTTFGLTLLGTIILAWVLPSYVTTAFVSLLPIASGMLLVAGSPRRLAGVSGAAAEERGPRAVSRTWSR